MAKVFINGELHEDSDATISTFDHGLVVGDGAFETVLLLHGRPFALGRHIARLNRSLAGLMISEVDEEEIANSAKLVVDSCDFAEGRVRITVTAGQGPLGSGRYAQSGIDDHRRSSHEREPRDRAGADRPMASQ